MVSELKLAKFQGVIQAFQVYEGVDAAVSKQRYALAYDSCFFTEEASEDKFFEAGNAYACLGFQFYENVFGYASSGQDECALIAQFFGYLGDCFYDASSAFLAFVAVFA